MASKLVADEGGNFVSSKQSLVKIKSKNVIVNGDIRPGDPPVTMSSSQSFIKIKGLAVGQVGDSGATTTQSFVTITQ